MSIAVIAFLLGSGTVAVAVATGIPDTSGLIHGCYATPVNDNGNGNGRSGQLRLVADPAQCQKGETPIAWSVTGPTGPQGPTGPTGANGTNGISGYEEDYAEFPTNVAGYALPGGNGIPTYTEPRDCTVGGQCVLRVYCSPGKVVMGGGYIFFDSTGGGSLNVNGNRPNTRNAPVGIFPKGDAWVVTFTTTASTSPSTLIDVWARCLSAAN